MLSRLLTTALAPALLLVSCVTPQMAADADVSDEAKLFGEFLAGTYASNVQDFDARSDYYSRAFARAQDDIFIGRRALSFALLDGDVDLARTLAMEILQTEPGEPMARMVLGQRAFSKGRHARAAEYFGADTTDLTMGIAMDIMQGWNAVAAGDPGAARTAWASMQGGAVFERLADLQTAILDAREGNVDAALARLDAVDEAELFSVESALTRARILSDAGRLEEAGEFLSGFAADMGNLETGPVRAYLDRLEAGEALDTELTPRQLAARALTEPSYAFFARQRALDAAELYLRMALDLDPDHSKAKLWISNILEGSGRDDEALALYTTIPDDDPYVVSARLAEANAYFDRDEDARALETLEAINAARPSVVTREALGRARLIRENYEDALPIYDALVESLSDEEIAANTQPLYFRGIANERLGNFPDAVRDFRRVLEIEPDNADALNYLGYTWVDRGENLAEAFDMIERAVELEPDSGAIIDSLGWAHYKLGQYGQARKHLEKAASLSPSSATIIDHLGDVYWKLGRFREAGYQWRRALDLDPTDEEREAIERKLEGGLDAVAADAAP